MNASLHDQKRIFISVASFCDPLLIFTIKSAIGNARHPERLSFGVVEQDYTSVESDMPEGSGRVAWLHVNPQHSRGACWARSLAMTLYAGEDYFFQIDSHSCFDPDWDVTLIETLERLSASSGNEKIALSMRPFAFEFEQDGSITRKRFTQSTLKLVPGTLTLNLSTPVMAFDSHDTQSMQDVPGFQISAAFLFARGQLVEETPYDPFLYFHGEEQNIAIRAFTHGWDIWHPNASPLFHLYKTRSANESPLHWDPQFEEKRKEKWFQLRDRADSRLGDLIAGRIEGAYGLGRKRSIEDYLHFAGLKMTQ